MRTARVLTLSPSMLCVGGFASGLGGCTWSFGGNLVLGGCLLQGGVCTWSGGVSAPGPGGVCSRSQGRGCLLQVPRGCQVLPPVNRMTNRCKNITLSQTSLAGGNKVKLCYILTSLIGLGEVEKSELVLHHKFFFIGIGVESNHTVSCRIVVRS